MKIPVKKKRSKREERGTFELENSYRPGRTLKIVFYALIVLIPLALAYNYYRSMLSTYKIQSFPLDDPWIHLTFARNLFEHMSFSYFKDEMVTAGSTSPLFTLLESFGFFFTKNEMVIGYALGVFFLVLSAVVFYRLAVVEMSRDLVFALLVTGLFVIDKWMIFISLSGMETTMFILFLLLASYFYRKRKGLLLGVTMGLIVWTRPDGFAFIAALMLDYAFLRVYSKRDIGIQLFTGKDLRLMILSFAGIIGLYFLMNLILSGSILPNTYNAKLTYYSPEFRSRWDFLHYEVWNYFTEGSYYVLMIGFLFSTGKLFHDIYKRNYNQNALYIFFVLVFVLVYFIQMPYAHRFGRYMMPLIPFFILVSTIGFRDLARLINRYANNPLFSKSLFYILVSVTFFIGAQDYDEKDTLFKDSCQYIYSRQVKAAEWLKKYTNANDIVATHDIGAIGYYSERKIIDVAGLVTPELIGKINDLNYVDYMQKYMADKGVTYLAFLREWYRVSNQNPLFTTVYTYPPEVMDVYKYEPGKTQILSKEANSMIQMMQTLVNQRAAQQIIFLGNKLLVIEPTSSLAYYYMAYAYQLLNDKINYEKSMTKAIQLFPDFKDAHLYFGEFLKNEGRLQEARYHYQRTLELEPANQRAAAGINEIDAAEAAANSATRK